MGFSRQEYWSGSPFPPPGDLPDPGIKPVPPKAPALQVDSLLLSHWESIYLQADSSLAPELGDWGPESGPETLRIGSGAQGKAKAEPMEARPGQFPDG